QQRDERATVDREQQMGGDERMVQHLVSVPGELGPPRLEILETNPQLDKRVDRRRFYPHTSGKAGGCQGDVAGHRQIRELHRVEVDRVRHALEPRLSTGVLSPKARRFARGAFLCEAWPEEADTDRQPRQAGVRRDEAFGLREPWLAVFL